MLTYHMVLGMYGFWLPNDPRGSWSIYVGSWELLKYGKATPVHTHASVAHAAHDHALRLESKTKLKYPPVQLTGRQAQTVGMAMGAYCKRNSLKVWACAILPEHIHLVMDVEPARVKKIMSHLKAAVTLRLIRDQLHPHMAVAQHNSRYPKCFSRGGWAKALESDEIPQAIAYVEQNPVKEGKRRQRWSFVEPYEIRTPSAPQ